MTTSLSTLCGVDGMQKTEPKALFEENQKLAYSTLWKYYPGYATDEDMKQEALLGLWKACITFDPGKSQFSTYAVTCIMNQIRMTLRDNSKQPPTVSLEASLAGVDGLTIGDTLEELAPSICDEYILLKEFLGGLPQRDQLLIKYKLMGLNQRQIAERLGITYNWCSKLFTRIYVEYDKRRGNNED